MYSTKKKSFFVAVICLILCVALLIGTTFAWFTDSVSNTGNKIQAGTLDIALRQYTDQWTDISNSNNPVFASGETTGKYWEPGYSQYAILEVANKGNLALKYRLDIVNKTATAAQYDICDVIDVYAVTTSVKADVEKTAAQVKAAVDANQIPKIGTLGELMDDEDGAAYGALYPSGTEGKDSAAYAVIALKMQESAGNDYQNADFVFDIMLRAAQYTYEEDGFGSSLYDQNAEYENIDTPDPPETENKYVTFSSSKGFTLGTLFEELSNYVTLETSTDTEAWTSWDGCGKEALLQTDGTYKIYLRGKNNTLCVEDPTILSLTPQDNDSEGVTCSGNIMTLLDYENPDNVTMSENAFMMLFYNCTSLISAPDIRAETMPKNCCYRMFFNCTSLKTAPTLSATALATSCYSNMFYGCKSLETAPKLPATNLAESCYSSMFEECTSLKAAPVLPADSLAVSCYESMFQGCTSLETAPTLSATALATSCYSNMFYGCKSLETAPTLSATALATSCYSSMFSGCKSLKTAPVLPAESLAENCYSSMFNGCTSLETAPALTAKTLATNCCVSMFKGCTSLKTAPTLSATALATSCYSSMFSGCKSLKTAPVLPAESLAENCYSSMFNGCTSLETAPALTATSLTTNCYMNMFNGCEKLKSAPALPATSLANSCYESMFCGCTSLETAPVLSATTLTDACYKEMFRGCSALQSAPELPAETLKYYCYHQMFYGCSSLKISNQDGTKIFTCPNTLSLDAVTDMFYDTGGTFKGTPDDGCTYYWYT